MDPRPIGVFDSGLGGLTAVKRLMEVMPGEDIIFLGDTGRTPYGGRSRETIMRYSRQDISFLRRFDIKAVIAACGTASSNGLSEIASEFDVPVFGVVDPASEAAVRATKTGKIGVIGTVASIRSGAYTARIKALLPSAEITEAACPLFVPLVENGRIAREDSVLQIITSEYLDPIRASGVDTLLLGCTHYPIISGAIGDVMGGAVLIDSGAETASKVSAYLAAHDMLSDRDRPGELRCFVTDSTAGFSNLAALFLQQDVTGSVEQVFIGD